MSEEQTLEYCFKCDEPTGCAGKADDSHYNEDGEGPFCWRCWCEDENPRLHELLAVTDKRIAELKKVLRGLKWTFIGVERAIKEGGTVKESQVAEWLTEIKAVLKESE